MYIVADAWDSVVSHTICLKREYLKSYDLGRTEKCKYQFTIRSEIIGNTALGGCRQVRPQSFFLCLQNRRLFYYITFVPNLCPIYKIKAPSPIIIHWPIPLCIWDTSKTFPKWMSQERHTLRSWNKQEDGSLKSFRNTSEIYLGSTSVKRTIFITT